MQQFHFFFEHTICEMDDDQREKFRSMHGYDPKRKSKLKGILPDVEPISVEAPAGASTQEPVQEPEASEIMFSGIPDNITSLSDTAFWISPEGRIVFLKNGFGKDKERHIDLIIHNPEKFGITKEDVINVFTAAGEDNPYETESPMISESGAREKLILLLIRRGWVRIRNYSRLYRWTINVGFFNEKVLKNLQNWAAIALERRGGSVGECYIDAPPGYPSKTYSMAQLANGEAERDYL